MKLKEILDPKNVLPDLKSATRDEVLEELVKAIGPDVPVEGEALLRILIEREEQSPTAMSGGIAVPHGRIPELGKFILAVGRSRMGVEFGADDGPTHIFFMLMAPTDDTVTHLKILARIARICRNRLLRDELLAAEGADGIYQRLMKEDAVT